MATPDAVADFLERLAAREEGAVGVAAE